MEGSGRLQHGDNSQLEWKIAFSEKRQARLVTAEVGGKMTILVMNQMGKSCLDEGLGPAEGPIVCSCSQKTSWCSVSMPMQER